MLKPEQQTVPLVYSFTIAQAFSVVKPFRSLFFRKIAGFLDFFHPPPRHTLGIYPRNIYLHYFFNKILIPLALHENRFFRKSNSFPSVALSSFSRRRRGPIRITSIAYSSVLPIFYLLFCRPYCFRSKSKFFPFPIHFFPSRDYNQKRIEKEFKGA